MILSHEMSLDYWLREPIRNDPPGTFTLWAVPFPDLKTLSPTERNLLRPVLERHPEYLNEIWCGKEAQ
jgi:hypothetical protein